MLNSLALRAAVGRATGCLLIVAATCISCVARETAPPGDGINVPSTVDLTGVLTASHATGSLLLRLSPLPTGIDASIPANI